MIYGYIRVSTDHQTVENQRFEILNFAKQNNLQIDSWIEETISGTKNYNKRALGRLLRRVKPGDTIICTELSRLGRSLFMIMEILNLCMRRDCHVWTIKDNYRLGNDIPSKVLAFAFAISAEIERDLISQRTKQALARCKAEGMKLGRPRGSHSAPRLHKLHRHRRQLTALLAQGCTISEVARHFKVSRTTIYSYLRYLEQAA
jgi:DNA invertase Pin-like site-specific DNA recombinase